MITVEPRAAAAKAAIKVAGGQTISSALPASAFAPAMILVSSPPEAASPFIFQLPATSGVTSAAAIEKSPPASGYQFRFGNAIGSVTSQSLFSCKELPRSLWCPRRAWARQARSSNQPT
jgi:hypothetical protein